MAWLRVLGDQPFPPNAAVSNDGFMTCLIFFHLCYAVRILFPGLLLDAVASVCLKEPVNRVYLSLTDIATQK
jgi:hypothetical protein